MYPSPEEIKMMLKMAPSQQEIERAIALAPPKEEIDRIFSEFKNFQKQNPGVLELAKKIRESEIKGFNLYEGVYTEQYNNLYSELDENNYHTELNENNEIIVVDSEAKENNFPFENSKDIIGLTELFESISLSEATNFINFLAKYPYLAFKESIGKRIFNEIENIAETNLIDIKEQVLYRARPWEKDREMHFLDSEMWEPPYGRSEVGRFNPIGINYLYMAENKEIASLEINSPQKLSIMEVTVASSIKVLDLTSKTSPIFELCNKKNIGSYTNPSEYLLPNYIAQCCAYLERKNGMKVEGIKYKSTLSDGNCLVLFNKSKDSFNNEMIINV